MSDKSIIKVDVGELSKPATVLFEKISDAVGGLYRPRQIKRVAEAEAQAAIIKAKGQIEISELEQQTFHRFLAEEAKKQSNKDEITQKALPQVADDAKPDQMENDWIANFFDRCRLISDNDMQTLWSKVLAGEATTPGTYSKRTVNFLSDLDKKDAALFTKLCGFGWMIGCVIPLVYDVKHEIYNKYGVNWETLSHLKSIGLIQFDGIQSFVLEGLPKKFGVTYYGTPVILEMQKETGNSLDHGRVRLIRVGQELAPICGSQPAEGFLDYVCERWKGKGYLKEAETPEPKEKPDSDKGR